jgi:Lipase (class 3)
MPQIQPKKQMALLKGSLKNLFFPPEKDEYEYFARAREIPFASAGDMSRAAWAADAAMLSYARHGPARMDDQELNRCLSGGDLRLQGKIGEDPGNWNTPGTQAIFATGDGFAILAFRGTEPDDPQDVCDDLELVLTPEPDYKSSAAPASGFLSRIVNEVSDPCFVHRGFQKALDRVWDQVYHHLAGFRGDNPTAEICITGHSLGGALALLTYSRFHDANVSAYTFGCPRVGNTAFAKRVAAGGKGHFRCVNFNDVVAHIPLESALYLHAPANCHRFDDGGLLDLEHQGALAVDLGVLGSLAGGLPADLMADSHKLDELPAPPGLVDHSPARYCVRLWNCV